MLKQKNKMKNLKNVTKLEKNLFQIIQMVWLVHCIEYGNSDYYTIEEFLTEKHPELKLLRPE